MLLIGTKVKIKSSNTVGRITHIYGDMFYYVEYKVGEGAWLFPNEFTIAGIECPKYIKELNEI